MKRLRRLPRWLLLLIAAVIIIGIVTWQQLQRACMPSRAKYHHRQRGHRGDRGGFELQSAGTHYPIVRG